jgi:hypothetical protein
MNVIESPSINPTLQPMPMEKEFNAWHLNNKTSRTGTSNSPDSCVESHVVRIHAVKVVKDTGGYFHGGLND